MRLALYHPWIYLQGGVERLLLSLVERSRHDWTVWTHHYRAESTFDGYRHLDVRELAPRISVRRSLRPLIHAASTIASTELPDEGARAVLVSSEGFGDLLLARTRLPAAAYCHTPLKILHDPVARRRLAAGSAAKATALRLLGPPFSSLDRRMWRRYRRVFVNSHETLTRCLRAGLEPSGAIDILHPGVDPRLFYDDGGERKPFVLVAGRIMWQKNIELAIETARETARRGAPVRTVIAGAVDDKSRPYLAALRALSRGLPVEFRVNPSDDELASLYRRCLAVLFTPCNEDFGLVALEAMASGAPVAAVDRGGPREIVVPGRTGWLLPDDPVTFADLVERIAADPDRIDWMRPLARERARRFTWDRFVSAIDDGMEQVARERAPVEPGARLALSGVRARPAVRDPAPVGSALRSAR